MLPRIFIGSLETFNDIKNNNLNVHFIDYEDYELKFLPTNELQTIYNVKKDIKFIIDFPNLMKLNPDLNGSIEIMPEAFTINNLCNPTGLLADNKYVITLSLQNKLLDKTNNDNCNRKIFYEEIVDSENYVILSFK